MHDHHDCDQHRNATTVKRYVEIVSVKPACIGFVAENDVLAKDASLFRPGDSPIHVGAGLLVHHYR